MESADKELENLLNKIRQDLAQSPKIDENEIIRKVDIIIEDLKKSSENKKNQIEHIEDLQSVGGK